MNAWLLLLLASPNHKAQYPLTESGPLSFTTAPWPVQWQLPAEELAAHVDSHRAPEVPVLPSRQGLKLLPLNFCQF